MQPKYKLPNSLEVMGLQRFMDEKYYKYGGYMKLIQMLEADLDNATIGRAFGPIDRPLSRNAIRKWRAQWVKERAND